MKRRGRRRRKGMRKATIEKSKETVFMSSNFTNPHFLDRAQNLSAVETNVQFDWKVFCILRRYIS
jgi:hypothetical protein